MSPRKAVGAPGPEPAPKRPRKRAKAAPVDEPEANEPVAGPTEGAGTPESDLPEVSPPAVAGDPDRIVVFAIEGQRYALPIGVVKEIQQIVEITEIPDSSEAVVGVINVRGQVVPVVDLRLLVGMERRDYGLQTPMIFTVTAHGVVALIVDQVEDVVDVPEGSMQAPSAVYALADRLLGVCRLDVGLVFVFSIDALIPPAIAVVGRR